jgi:hypothetical protein
MSINIRTKFHPIGNATEMPVASQNCSLSVDNAVNVSGADPGGGAPDILAGDGHLSGFGRIVLIGALLAGGLGVAGLRAQTVLGDPRDAPRIFASNCSACHKSPQGLAKSGQVAGFLRQHYTTGPEMSAAMAAYLVAAGPAPAAKKGAATADSAAKSKSRKGEQLAAHPSTEQASEAAHQRTLRGKQRQTKSHEEAAPPAPPAAPAAEPVEETKPAVSAALNPEPPPAATPPPPAPIVLDIPLPPMPDGPPPELAQSLFASSPLP